MGKEHDGIKTIIEMVHGTRLDTSAGSAALMRQGLLEVIQLFFFLIDYCFIFESLIISQTIFSKISPPPQKQNLLCSHLISTKNLENISLG